MSSIPTTPSVASASPSERNVLRRNWPVFLILGALMVAFGTFAVGWACLTTLTVMAVWLFGCLLIAGGVVQLVSTFFAGRWSGRLVHLIIGLLYLLVGAMFMSEPKDSAVRLTLIISIVLMISGIVRIVSAISQRFEGRGSVLFSGVVTLILGIMIYEQWPVSGLWAIGLFIGIELIFNGWAWIMMSMVLKRTKPE